MLGVEGSSVKEVQRTVLVTTCVTVTTGVLVVVEAPIFKQVHATETLEAG
jgi:ABC-type Fe2+-enterobactin transport system substrate-binding protein